MKWIKLEKGTTVSKKEESKKLVVGTKVLVYWSRKPDVGWYHGEIMEVSVKKPSILKKDTLRSPEELSKVAQVSRLIFVFFFVFFFRAPDIPHSSLLFFSFLSFFQKAKRKSGEKSDEINLADGQRRTLQTLINKKPRIEGPSNQQLMAEIGKLRSFESSNCLSFDFW